MTASTASASRRSPTPVDLPAFAQEPRVARLLSLYAPAYQLAVRTLRTTRDAEDVVQQAYLKALAHLPPDLPEAEVQPWFFRVTVNAARDHLRAELRRQVRESGANAGADPTEPPLPDGVTREMLGDLQTSLNELEERLRMPLVLCYEQGLSQNEAAHVLDMPPRTLSKYLEEGLETLRKKLADRGHTAAPALLLVALGHGLPAVPIGIEAIAREILRTAPRPTGSLPASSLGSGGVSTGMAANAAGIHVGWKIAGVVCLGLFVCAGCFLLLLFAYLSPTVSTAWTTSSPVTAVQVSTEGATLQYDFARPSPELHGAPPALPKLPQISPPDQAKPMTPTALPIQPPLIVAPDPAPAQIPANESR